MLNEGLKKEFIKMCIGVGICSVIMIIIFAICGYFKLNVIYGTLLGDAATLLNYFLLALSVERVTEKEEVKQGQAFMSMSYMLRLLMLGVVIILAIKLPCFNYLAAIIPLVFPRIIIFAADLIEKRKKA